MNNKTQFIDLLEDVSRESEMKKDFEVEFSNLRMMENGNLVSLGKMGEHSGSELTDFALTQLLTKAEMPVRYMKRLLNENPRMVAKQFNYWMSKEEMKGKKALLRGIFDDERELKVRGVLSDKYTILDNDEVLESLVDVADNLPDFQVESLYNDDKKLHLRLSFNDKKDNFGISPEGKEDIIKVGLDIQNSEIGYSSLIIAPINYRLVCSNGMKAWKAEEGMFKKRHVHMEPSELREMMVNSMSLAVDKGEELLDGMRQSRKIILPNSYEYIEEKGKEARLSKKQIQIVKDNFDIEPEKNLFGIVNAFTRTARDVKSHDTRMILERFASGLMLAS